MGYSEFPDEANLREALERVRSRIAAARARSPNAAGQTTIVAVTKAFPVEALMTGYQAGHRIFGESRVQEAAAKLPQFSQRDQCQVHFIGRLQSNKARQALELFDLIESVDSLKLLRRLDGIAGQLGKRVPVYLQVNAGGDPAKSGFDPHELRREITAIAGVENLAVAGLMTIAPLTGNEQRIRDCFSSVRRLREEISKEIPACKDLSMGMSGDFELAVEEGATHVRLGSVLFGRRPGTGNQE